MDRTRLAAAAAILIAIGPTPLTQRSVPAPDDTQAAHATPVPLDARDPSRRRVGALSYLEGWRIESPNSGFGGWSALVVSGGAKPARGFLLVSDGGWSARFTLSPAGVLSGFAIRPLPGAAGDQTRPKFERDLEAMTRAPNGDFVAGFENVNGFRRYDAALTREIAATAPQVMAKWPANVGAEAVTRLSDGRWLVLGEATRRERDGRNALMFDRAPSDPAARSFGFAYDPEGKGSPSDAVSLADGRVVILHRAFTLPFGFRSVVGLADPAAIRPGKRWTSRTLAVLAPPLVSENFEGVAVDPDPACNCIWIVSDDNQSLWQRTLLLRFRLPEPERPAQKRRR